MPHTRLVSDGRPSDGPSFGRGLGALCSGWSRLTGGGGRPAARQPRRRTREFASSFEAGEPAPDWLNTVDTGPDGKKRASGVDGGYSTGIPGNVTDHVTEVRASGENTRRRRGRRRTSSTASPAPSG